MKVLMISGDKRILTPGSDVYARLQLQKAQVDQLDVCVWPQVHSWRETRRVACAGHYDVITAQDPFWRGLLAWRLARKTGAKLNLQVHTDLSAYAWPKRLFAESLLRRADSIRVVSEKLRTYVIAMGVTAPVHVLPIFVDISRFKELVHQPQEKKKTILWIGRLEEEKDPEAALALFKKVKDSGIGASLVVLGSGSKKELLLKSARELEFNKEELEFPGWADPLRYLAKADVVISTSKHESWGASIVEALAAGVPVVAPDVGIAKEAGAIIADHDDMAEKVIEVLNSGQRGELKIKLPTAEEWARAWKETLV